MNRSVDNSAASRVDDAKVGVGFIDILFGVVATETLLDLAKEPVHRGPVSAGLVLTLFVTYFSWVGFHNAKTAAPPIRFWSPIFVQVALDIAIVGAYYLLAQQALAQSHQFGKETVAFAPLARTMVWIFVLYSIWDALNLVITTEPRSCRALAVTFCGLVAMTALYLLFSRWLEPTTAASEWLAVLAYVVAGYGYRVVQERATPTPRPTP